MMKKLVTTIGISALLSSPLWGSGLALAATSGSGSAHGVSASLQLLPDIGAPVTASIAPTPNVSGSAPPDYLESQSVLSAAASIANAVSLSTGVVNASSSSSLGLNEVDSAAGVDNTNLSISLANALSLTADAIDSTASASCSGGTVQLSGETTLVNANLTVLGEANVVLDASPLANTSILPGILGPLGLSIVLNEQIVTGDSLTVNALHVDITGGLIGMLGTLTGDIILGQSQVEMPDCELPDLEIAMTGPASGTAGTSFDYTITLNNVGLAPSSGQIQVTDNIPAGLTIDSVSAGPNFSCSTAGQTVSCNSSTAVAASASNVAVVVITVVPGVPGNVSNSASVSGGGDQSPANNTTLPLATSVNAVAGPDLLVNVSAPLSVEVGQVFDYQILLSNVGLSVTWALSR